MNRFGLILGGLMLLGAGCIAEPDTAAIVEPEFVTPEPVQQKEIEPGSLAHPGVLADEEIKNKQVRVQTNKGEIVFELFPDTAPLTVSNFVYLANQGYYDGLIWHRVVPGFVIQGGDPLGNGTGGPGYKFQDELQDPYAYDKGIVAMANSGPNTNGSQFFIMLEDNPLPKQYSIFGRVLSGQEIVDQIAVGDSMTKITVEERGN